MCPGARSCQLVPMCSGPATLPAFNGADQTVSALAVTLENSWRLSYAYTPRLASSTTTSVVDAELVAPWALRRSHSPGVALTALLGPPMRCRPLGRLVGQSCHYVQVCPPLGGPGCCRPALPGLCCRLGAHTQSHGNQALPAPLEAVHWLVTFARSD